MVIDVFVLWNYGSDWVGEEQAFDETWTWRRFNNLGDCLDKYSSCKAYDNPLVSLTAKLISTLIYIIFESVIIIGIYFLYKELKKFNEVN